MSLAEELANIYAAEEQRRLEKIREQERFDKMTNGLVSEAKKKIYQLEAFGLSFTQTPRGTYTCSDDRLDFEFRLNVIQDLENDWDDTGRTHTVYKVSINVSYKVGGVYKPAMMLTVNDFDRVMANLLHSLGYKLES